MNIKNSKLEQSMRNYLKTYEKGLELYSNGVLIMEKCADLLPDYFSFVKVSHYYP